MTGLTGPEPGPEASDNNINYENEDEISKLKEELAAWRDCVIIDALMGGPRFRGFNQSAGQRVFNRYWNDKSR